MLTANVVLGTARFVRRRMRQALNARRLRARGETGCRVVLGASGRAQYGWLASDIESLDVRLEDHWLRYFTRSGIDALLAEHVWEHLEPVDALRAARLCYEFLKPGGWLRVAVPDGLHPDPQYIRQVEVGGFGCGARDHKVLYTYRTLKELFERAGFHVTLLEYFDESGRFHRHPWDTAEGWVRRSAAHDPRNHGGVLRYTSVIADARKGSS